MARSQWLIIARREFLERVRTKWFVIVTLLGPLAMVGIIVVPAYLGAKSDAKKVTIEVIDEGPGVAPEIRTPAFERFWQADGSGPTGSGGAGLGLSICKRIVELHGGTISIHSNLPKGTKVRVRLPLLT